ncbi:primosomal protein N' [Alterisphingorhabdus coralli]|uniref:Replication restart protein PriA n=1 Tax=Alterisphingorhabdus coralli TaxID=3071408 RepID=A0AA97F6H9_9SPHN|nr:primosomal protein N' [Parasphingorhabdus sp. SCSIO 66989]WOE74167.1 primosomal protein N' [Parasphingorhabdus sp. SCSIO 66989]
MASTAPSMQKPGQTTGRKQRVRVVLLTAVIGPLDYAVPQGMTLTPGDIVTVPLGPRQLTGVVWEDERAETEDVEDSKLRPVIAKAGLPPLSDEMRRLAEWASDYYLASLPNVLRMAIPGSAALKEAREITEYSLKDEQPDRMTDARKQAYERLEGRQGTVRELAAAAEVSEGVIRGLVNGGFADTHLVPTDAPFDPPDPDADQVDLSDTQQDVANQLVDAIKEKSFAPILLDGVTGSGKTEVYFEAVAEAIRQGRQCLVLLPEIALTQPFLERFAKRFGTRPVAWHSGLRQSERRRAWQAIANGSAHVIVGARSSLFLPYQNLGLIIVDEAHETSFKQEDGVRYNARDVAVMRAHMERFPVILASATPAIESHHMAEIGQYQRLSLPARFGGAIMPDITPVNLIETPPERNHWIAPPLVEALEETLERGEQSLLFLNRRGYAPLTLCRNCGHRIECPNCSAWMVEHRLTHRLACHHCGHVMPMLDSCPECGAEDSLVACGPGVERIADEVAARLPDARSIVVTSDTIWSPAKAEEFVQQVTNNMVDIIIGTQLVTKGYHFPNLTLVGVIDADIGLEGGDLRAAERSFQQISQVAGRAGRAEKPGRVLVQTRNPEAPVIAALIAGDRDAFYAAELASREMAMMPPFGRLGALIISSEDQAEANEAARMIGHSAPDFDGFTVYGPAPAPLSMLRGRYRFRLLVHARRTVPMQKAIRDWLDPIKLPQGVRVALDVDPYSFV